LTSTRREVKVAAARAVERVLRAERDAEASLAETRAQAQALLEAAREDALVIVNRSMERAQRWQAAHAQALQGRLQMLRDQAAARASARRAPDAADIDAAVERTVDRLVAPASGNPPDDVAH